MQKMTPAASPDAYVAGLDGWRRDLVVGLRAAVRGAASMDEVIKWGHLVYLSNGPVLLIRAESERVLLGFWRGKRLRGVEPRLKASGGYELANLDLRQGMTIGADVAARLVREGVNLNKTLGDPTARAR